MDRSFAENLYFRELDRRTQLDEAPTLRVAVLASIAAVFSYYSTKYSPEGIFLPWLFLICAAGALFFAMIAAVWIMRSFTGFEWQYLANPATMLDHYRALKVAEDRGLTAHNAEGLFETNLLDRLVAAAAHNALNNNRRSELLYYSNIYLTLALAFTIIAGVPVLYQTLAHWPFF